MGKDTCRVFDRPLKPVSVPTWNVFVLYTPVSVKSICCWLNHTLQGLLCWLKIQPCLSSVTYVREGTSAPEGESHEEIGMNRTWTPGMWKPHHAKMKVAGLRPAFTFQLDAGGLTQEEPQLPQLALTVFPFAFPGEGYHVGWPVLFLVLFLLFQNIFLKKCYFSMDPQIGSHCMVNCNHHCVS